MERTHMDQAKISQLRMRISLDDKIYRGMPKLKIRGKELGNVPDEVFALTSLEVLDLSPERESCLYYRLTSLSSDVRRLINLRVLMLDTNEMVDIPDELCLLNHLERLSLSNNNFSELPENFGRLQSLESLHMSNNEFSMFPLQLCELENLRFLDFCDNKLMLLPTQINKLQTLETLLLYNNDLQELPNEICDMKELRTLWIGENNIRRLPSDIGELHFLDWGIGSHTSSSALDGNPLTTPPIDVCKQGIAAISQFFEMYRLNQESLEDEEEEETGLSKVNGGTDKRK